MEYSEIKTLKGMVGSVLEDMPLTRNSDISLLIEVWKRFYPKFVLEEKHQDGATYTVGHKYVRLTDLFNLPREDNVKRVRAYFQNVKKLYPPTEWAIAKKRGLVEDEWRVAMGYPTKETTGTVSPEYTPPSHQ